MVDEEFSLAQQHPLRLLLVADSLDAGGAEQHVVHLASALAQQGYAVTIACSVTGALAPIAQQSGVVVQPLLRSIVKRRASPAFFWKLARFVYQGHFELVHAHMYASALASAWATRGTTIPLVMTEHSEASWRSPFACQLSQWCYSRTAHIIAVSREIRRRLVEQDRVPFDRVSLIMNAISPPPEGNAAKLLRDLPVTCRNKSLVGVIARLQEEKGVVYFLEAIASLGQILPEVHCLIIGEGPLRQALQSYAKRLGVQERAHFLGFRSDARSLIGLLDILVVPSLSEGTPLVTLEAMSAGIPVVASAVGGIPEQIRHGREGLLVPPGDSKALGEALLCLLQEPALRKWLGEAGRRRALSTFRFATMVQATEAVYSAALGRQSPGVTHLREFDDPLAEIGR